MVLSTYFPGSAATLDAARANSLASIPDGQAKTDGIATGDAAALAMIALRANDGSSPRAIQDTRPACSRRMAGHAELSDREWSRVGAFFQWQNVTPFGIPNASDFLLGPPPRAHEQRIRQDLQRGDDGRERSTAQSGRRIGPMSRSSTRPPRQPWSSIRPPRQVAQQQQRSLSENARALALINMAINDSLVASFFNKYHYNFWRPETAIRAGDTDGNREDRGRSGLPPIHRDSMFPELSLKSRQLEAMAQPRF